MPGFRHCRKVGRTSSNVPPSATVRTYRIVYGSIVSTQYSPGSFTSHVIRFSIACHDDSGSPLRLRSIRPFLSNASSNSTDILPGRRHLNVRPTKPESIDGSVQCPFSATNDVFILNVGRADARGRHFGLGTTASFSREWADFSPAVHHTQSRSISYPPATKPR